MSDENIETRIEEVKGMQRREMLKETTRWIRVLLNSATSLRVRLDYLYIEREPPKLYSKV